MDHIWLVELSRCWFPVERYKHKHSYGSMKWTYLVYGFFKCSNKFFEYVFPSGKLFILDSLTSAKELKMVMCLLDIYFVWWLGINGLYFRIYVKNILLLYSLILFHPFSTPQAVSEDLAWCSVAEKNSRLGHYNTLTCHAFRRHLY